MKWVKERWSFLASQWGNWENFLGTSSGRPWQYKASPQRGMSQLHDVH